MEKIVLSTRNKHKIQEIRRFLRNLPITIVSLETFKDVPEIEEDGDTLEQNAIKKAVGIATHFHMWALADDTGLEVEYLHNEPGVYSARWAGPGCTYRDNNRKLLRLLKGVPPEDRRARFRCVIALADPNGDVSTVEGSVNGYIAEHVQGKKGFGYDPLFYMPAYRKTFAELSLDVKNTISHRGKALVKIKKTIQKLTSLKRIDRS